MITKAFASLAVDDVDAAAGWYERILGPGTPVMRDLVEWYFPDGGGLQVYRAPERAGRGSCTLVVHDIDAVAQRLDDTAIALGAQPTRGDLFDTIMIKDPDGNSIAFAMPATDRHRAEGD